jgi:hypothetical protein
LRLALQSKADALEISVVKRRGSIGGTPFKVKPFPMHWSKSVPERQLTTVATSTSELLSLGR